MHQNICLLIKDLITEGIKAKHLEVGLVKDGIHNLHIHILTLQETKEGKVSKMEHFVGTLTVNEQYGVTLQTQNKNGNFVSLQNLMTIDQMVPLEYMILNIEAVKMKRRKDINVKDGILNLPIHIQGHLKTTQ